MEVVCLIVQIHEYKGKQELYVKQKLIILDNLVEISKIQNTQAFNEIKGGRSASIQENKQRSESILLCL